MIQTENQAVNFLLEAFFRSALLSICIIKTLHPLLLAGFGNLMPFVMHNNSIEMLCITAVVKVLLRRKTEFRNRSEENFILGGVCLMASKEKGMKSVEINRFLFFAAMLAGGFGLMLIDMALTGNTFQKFTDVVCEFTSIHGSNKSAERNLFYMFSIGGDQPFPMFPMRTVILLSFVLAVIFCAWSDKCLDVFERGILILQLFIPLTLFVYVASDYKYGEEIRHIHVPYKIQLLIYLLIAFFVAEALIFIKKYWKSAHIELGSVISFGLCVSILAFNRFSGSGAILSADLHHPFENIIGFSQIFELGQKAFEEYIPVSGMYSVVQGFFLSFFGHGQVFYYFLTQNVFYLVVIAAIVWLLRRQMRAEWVLFVSIVYPVMDYNRIALILPVMLLLAWPKLIGNKNLWLKAWYLTSFVHALYYPVFGAAVCVGFLPLGIWQVISYAKSGGLLSDIKRLSFWIGWGLCQVPVVLGIPYLIGTMKHMLAMGGQTVYAVFVFVILLTDRFLKDAGTKKRLIVYAAVLLGAVSGEGFFRASSSVNLAPYYTVPDGYVYVENDQVERLGTCFAEQGMYDNIENTYNSVLHVDREDAYLGLVGNFGLYYLCGLKGDSTMELAPTIKGYDAARETVDLIKKQGTIVGAQINSINNYYFYYWLVSSGAYVWSQEDWRFFAE